MQYRRNTLYRVLFCVFLLIGVLLIVLSLLLLMMQALRIALYPHRGACACDCVLVLQAQYKTE